ncbi:MAG: polyprenyl synthetase family protein [Cloacibacterium sp.]
MEFIDRYQEIVAKAIEKHSFKNKPTELYEPMNYIISHGGKRLRPIMVLMANELFGGNIEKAIKPALAIEFFHNFTLIHDDIMDDAPLRRGKPTIHTLHGINIGILSGDALLIKAYQFFEDLEPELFKECIKIFSETGAVLCEGQQMDVNFETMKNVTYDDYIEMITNKTGVLSAASFQIGALIAGAKKEDAELLYNFGKHIGIAFQIMDDYLDVFGNVEQFGKKHAGDIYENKKTVLYFLAMEHANEAEKKELDYWYSKKTENIDKIYSVEKIFRRNKVDEKVLRLIQKHNEIGHDFLKQIDAPEEKKKPFMELANYLLRRNS